MRKRLVVRVVAFVAGVLVTIGMTASPAYPCCCVPHEPLCEVAGVAC